MKKIHAVAALLAPLITSCVAPQFKQTVTLDFLKEGVARREEVIRTLGAPAIEYPTAGALAYRLRRQQDGYVQVPREPSSWNLVNYSLILVFDTEGILRKRSLILVRREALD